MPKRTIEVYDCDCCGAPADEDAQFCLLVANAKSKYAYLCPVCEAEILRVFLGRLSVEEVGQLTGGWVHPLGESHA